MSKQSMEKARTIEDSLRQSIPILLVPTELQRKILYHVCTIDNVNYETLTEEIGRDRITILQSIESLIKHGYIEKQKDNPQKEKSKLAFVPTLRGMACIWSFYPFDLKLSISRYKIQKEDEITTYLAFVNDVFKFKHQHPMLKDLFANIERDYLNIEKGHAAKKRLIKECFTAGILKLIQQKDYDARKLFNRKGIQWLNTLYSKEELNEFKEFFVRTKQNLTITIEQFPV
jgi:hypothetical protein